MLKTKLGFAILGAAICSAPAVLAKTGAPHTVGATSNFDEVSLSWQAPHAEKQLKWHNGRDYNGDMTDPSSPQTIQEFYAGSLFTAADLVASVGENIEAVDIFFYRPVVGATAVIFENGEIVAEADADMSKYEKNSWQRVAFDKPVTIKADSEYRVAVRWHAGSNMDFVAIKDDSRAASGRGDQFSLDGKTWTSTLDGSYLVTAILANDVDEAPASYDIYRDGEKVASATETSAVLAAQPDGKHTYSVHAVYGGAVHASYALPVSVRSLANSLPGVTFNTSAVSDLDVAFDWVAPLKGGDVLSWNDGALALNIGGTATTNTKVWIKNEYTPADLIGFVGGKITGIKAYFAENCVTAVTAWVMRDGAFVTYKAAPAEAFTDLQAGWFSVTLDEPVEIEAGHTYSYGVYVLHTPKMHPIGVGSSATVNTKGNSFSTSSPNSTDFAKSNPSYKTLRSGGIEGNWMLTADIVGAPAPLGALSYDVYRDGELVKSGVAETEYSETVADLGRYVYSVVARDAAGHASDATELAVNVTLPAAYTAPALEGGTFDSESRTVALNWSTDKIVTKAGEATYMVGFDEDMTMHWGAQYTADELAAYKGLAIKKLSFIVGDEVKDLKLGVYTSKGVALYEEDLSNAGIQPLGSYVITLPQAIDITGDQDLVLAYSGTLAGGTSPIILDAGPLTTNGARVSLSNGATWMNLGTINSTYNNYNIVIGAFVGEREESAAKPAAKRALLKAEEADNTGLRPLVVNVAGRAEEIEALGEARRVARAPQSTPKVVSFNVYKNGKVVANTRDLSFSERLDKFDVFRYYVTSVFSNGWESGASDVLTVSNTIEQRSLAPYGLVGTPAGDDLSLAWEAPSAATVLTYVPEGDEQIQGLGMTGGTSLNTHIANRFSVEDLKPHVGKKIDHIQFGLADVNLTSASIMVIIGENIVYTQSVPVSSLIVGINDVRLNEPFEIPANAEVGAGYIVSYKSGVKPLGMASNVAVPNYSDVISANATPGYWYSLLNKYNMDRTFWVKTILAANDQELNTHADAPTSYNVYCDGVLVAKDITGTSFTVAGAADGVYHVTAVDAAGNESGESNKVKFNAQNAVGDIVADSDATAPVEYFDLQGRRVEPAAGTTVIRRQGSTVTKLNVK